MSKARELSQRAGVDGALSNRNLIINGAMQVAQRGTSILATNAGYKTVDRMYHNISAGAWTCTQESDAPVGFSKSAKLSCVSTTGASAWDVVQFAQVIEGNNLQHLSYGTASAQTVTLSFWVKSNVTGTYSVRLYNPEGQDRLISKNYTINASGVWEYKIVTFAGDTARNIADGAVYGLNVAWWVDAGSGFSSGTTSDVWRDYQGIDEAPNQVRVGASAGNYWQITGVQLEVGDTATPFEHRSYGQELALCQRYYQKSYPQAVTPSDSYVGGVEGPLAAHSTSHSYGSVINYPVVMRTYPTITFYANAGTSGTAGKWAYYNGSWNVVDNIGVANITDSFFAPSLTKSSGYAAQNVYLFSGNYTLDAEL